MIESLDLIDEDSIQDEILPPDGEDQDRILKRINSSNLTLLRESVELRLSRIHLMQNVNNKYKDKLPDEVNENLIVMREVILSISQRLETEEKYNEIREALDALVEANPQELETATSDLLAHVIGHDSKTCNLLRFIHQNIIFACIWQLKISVTKEVMTGDVQGPSGWQICVLFANDVISISHKRREKSLGLPQDQSFWFEWILHMTINRNVDKLISCNLRICDLRISNQCDELTRDKWKRLFCNGDLMIC